MLDLEDPLVFNAPAIREHETFASHLPYLLVFHVNELLVNCFLPFCTRICIWTIPLFVWCHILFDIKMEDFRHKAWLVAGGHLIEIPATITYASVMSRETGRIALMIATLNDLEVSWVTS